MLRTFWNLADVQLGYNPQRLLTAHIELPDELYKSPHHVVRFWERVQEKISQIPGVIASTAMAGLPPERPINANDTFIEGFHPVPGGPGHNIDYWQSVGERFFETMGTRLIEGRYFDDRRIAGCEPDSDRQPNPWRGPITATPARSAGDCNSEAPSRRF